MASARSMRTRLPHIGAVYAMRDPISTPTGKLTMFISSPSHHTILCTALMAALASPAAQADTLTSSASASLNNLTFTLIDLDPNDGIAPGMTLSGGGRLLVADSSNITLPPDVEQFVSITGTSFPAVSVSGAAGLGSVALGTNSLAGDATGTLENAVATTRSTVGSDANSRWHQQYFETYTTAGGLLGWPYIEGSLSEQLLAITLTANTSLVIEGTASWSLAVFNQPMHGVISSLDSQVTGFSQDAQRYAGFTNMARAGFAVSLSGTQDPAPSQFEFEDRLTDANYDCAELVENCVPQLGPDQSRTMSRNFSVSYANSTNQSADVNAFFYADASVEQVGYLNYYESTPQIPTIPEPGTYALMGLGLVGLAWARKRHQA